MWILNSRKVAEFIAKTTFPEESSALDRERLSSLLTGLIVIAKYEAIVDSETASQVTSDLITQLRKTNVQ